MGLFDNFKGRTSQVGATHLMVSLTLADTLTHLIPGHAGVMAGVVGLMTNVLAVLVGVITLRPHRSVTGRGLGGFSPIVTTKHNVMKYMENDEYFILFIRHFPCPSPIECIHQHPIKWIHQCICTQRDITGHWSQGEIL